MTGAAAIPRYADGRIYTAARGRDAYAPKIVIAPCTVPVSASMGWSTFWKEINSTLGQNGYERSSRVLYRSVLRGFARFARCQPERVDAPLIEDYLKDIAARQYSWHWLGMNTSVLRTVFDKLCSQVKTNRLVTPKRSYPLPEILNQQEIRTLLAAATNTRDQLLLGLLYGCGLKPNEVLRLTWGNCHCADGSLHIHSDCDERKIDIPPDLLPVLAFGKKHCSPDDYIFQGRYSGTPLSQRMLELIVRRARNAAGILKTVTPMTLRHTYAVHCLEAGASVRSVQASLGHQDIRSSWRYVRCTLPNNLESPLDTLKRKTGRNRLEENCFEPPPTAPTHKLFAEPPSVEPMDLPFREPEDRWGSRIYRLLKTHFSNRFLCSRRQSPRGG